jgi:hypothetical protein
MRRQEMRRRDEAWMMRRGDEAWMMRTGDEDRMRPG